MSNILQPNKLVVNSFFKQSVGETNDDFTVQLPNTIQNIKSIAFNTIIFSNSMKPFKGAEYGANQNNVLALVHDVGGTDTAFTITIDSSYVFQDGDAFADYLKALLNSGGRSGYDVLFSLEFGAILQISNSLVAFSINYDATPRGWTKCGFAQGATGVSTVEGTNNISIARTSMVSIHSNLADGDVLTSVNQDRYDIGVVVPITSTYGGVISFSSSNDRVISEQISGLQTLSFVLRDDEGDIIGLSPTSYVHIELSIEYNRLDEPIGAAQRRAPLPTMA